MFTGFTPVSLDFGAAYQRFYARMPEPAADYTFTNLWAWAEAYGLEWTEAHGLIWLRQTRDVDQPCLWSPVGDWRDIDFSRIPELEGAKLARVPEGLCAVLAAQCGERLHVTPTPGQWEYVYATHRLVTLQGEKLRKKRSHIKAYTLAYGEDCRPLTPVMVDAALAVSAAWMRAKEEAGQEFVRAEHRAISRMLEAWASGVPDLSGLCGLALFAAGRMTAFCLAEAMRDDMLVVHVEKALPGVQGAYQAINRHCARTLGQGFAWINREQDSDEPGLRQAKRSYDPAFQLRKATVRIA